MQASASISAHSAPTATHSRRLEAFRHGRPLTARGYRLEELGDGERIIATAIREPMVIGSDGTLTPMTPGSTRPTTLVMHHAGIHKTRRFSFNMP